MANETIADIVREMRGQGGDDGYPLDIKRYADRIEAAAKREKELSLAICDKCEAGVFRNENYRLRSALKPVMSCDVIFWEGEDPWYAENRTVKNASYGQVACTTAPDTAIGIANCHNAVREAQRVMLEGGEK